MVKSCNLNKYSIIPKILLKSLILSEKNHILIVNIKANFLNIRYLTFILSHQ